MSQSRRSAALATVLVLFATAGAACTKTADDTAAPAATGSAAQQVQATSAAPPAAPPERYNGGVPKLDLKGTTVGFSQSEKEANPFRIAETQSIKDEAAKRGIKLHDHQRPVAVLNKQITDVQELIAQGAKAAGHRAAELRRLGPGAQQAAGRKKVPIITIDRQDHHADGLQGLPRLHRLGLRRAGPARRRRDDRGHRRQGRGGDPARRVRQQRHRPTAPRASRTSSRPEGPGLKIVFEQTGDFTREKGQQVTEQLIQSNPGINGIYAENDEMAPRRGGRAQGRRQEARRRQDRHDRRHQSAVQGIVDGWIAGVIESNPRFGPLAFQTAGGLHQRQGRRRTKIIISDNASTTGKANAQ